MIARHHSLPPLAKRPPRIPMPKRRLPAIGWLAGAMMLLLAAATGGLPPTMAQGLRIAAVVNEDIISRLDVEERLRLLALTSGVAINQQILPRLRSQVLRDMIDESLQRQAAAAANVRVPDSEVSAELDAVAARNNMSAAAMQDMLHGNGIDPAVMRRQIETQLMWNRFAQRNLSGNVQLSEDEIDTEMDRLAAFADKPRKRVYEIVLPIENPEQEAATVANAERLLAQIRAGADFASLAREFSKSGSARNGGDIGWIAPGQLQPEIDLVLAGLGPGMVSRPIRGLAGVSLIYVTDERLPQADPDNAIVDFLQVTARPSGEDGADSDGNADQNPAADTLMAQTADIAGCAAMAEWAREAENTTVARARDVRIADLPANLADALRPLAVGETAAPPEAGNDLLLLTLCAREARNPNLPARREVQTGLYLERLNHLARRHLRDLRHQAFIDLRL